MYKPTILGGDKQKSDLERFSDSYKGVLPDSLYNAFDSETDVMLDWFTTSLSALGGMWQAAPLLFTMYNFDKTLATTPTTYHQIARKWRSSNNNALIDEFHKDLTIEIKDFLTSRARGTYRNMVDYYQQNGIYPSTEEVFKSYLKRSIDKPTLLKKLRLTEPELIQVVGIKYFGAMELYREGLTNNMEEAESAAGTLLDEMKAFNPRQKAIIDRFQTDSEFREEFLRRLKERMSQQKENLSIFYRKSLLLGN